MRNEAQLQIGSPDIADVDAASGVKVDARAPIDLDRDKIGTDFVKGVQRTRITV